MKNMQSHNFEPLHEIVAKNDVQQLTSKLMSLRQTLGTDKMAEVLNKKNDEGKTPLHSAVILNESGAHYKLVEILLENGADPNSKDEHECKPLWYLVHNCNLEILNLFFKFKADFNFLDREKTSIWTKAFHNFSNLDVIKFIVQDAGLDVNHQDKWGKTPLHYATFRIVNDNHYEVIKYLLKMGADVNAKDGLGLTPFWYLVRFSANWRVVELLLKYNADVHVATEYGRNILFVISSYNHDVEVLDKLLNTDLGLDVNHRDVDKRTPLHNIYYRFSINIKKIKCFVKNGANVNAFSNNGVTPLIEITHRASHERDEKFFLENKISLDFLLEQTDFGKVLNNVHIFYYDEDRSLSYYLWKWILEHLAKLKFLSIPIHPIIQEFIENHADYKDHLMKCTKELEEISNTKPQNSWITLFNLLVDNRRKLKNYAGNKDLVEDVETNDWLEMFPIYGALLKKNVEKGLRRRELFDKSSILLNDCLPIFSSTHLILKDVLDCILSKKVLSKFCKCRFLPSE